MKKCVLGSILVLIALVSFAQPVIKLKFIDSSNMDLSVKPGQNFYNYANGAWIKNNPIPPSKTSWGSFLVLRDASLDALKNILEEAAKNPEKNRLMKMTGDFYASGMDSIAIEKLGFDPIKNDLAKIDKINTVQDLVKEIASMRVNGIASPLFGFYIDQDDRNAKQYIAKFGQGGTSLPDRDYYLKNDARITNIRKEFLLYMTELFRMVGTEAAKAKLQADNILALETQLAKAQYSRVEMRDPVKLYHKFFVDDFSRATTNINWRNLMQQMNVTGQDSILVSNPTFLKTVDSLLTATSIATWKAYLQWYVIKNSVGYLSNDFVNRNFKFSKVLSGQKEITPRWQRLSGLVDNNLGELLGQLYVKKYFKPEAKTRMIELVKNLQQTFEDRIKRLDWMSAATKSKAIIKLDAFTKKIGYTDKWKTYDGLVITRNNFLENIRNANKWGYKDNIDRLGKPIDKTEWGLTPPTINATYSPSKNQITFPAGILQFPFFDFAADDAINYGGIGAVIGHEMTHGFDDQGRQFDADGNLRDWWTAEDAKQFKTKADLVVSQYDAYTVLDTLHVNGKLTLGENLADLGGLAIAYEAFKKTPQGKTTTKIEGFTPDQRFFLSWAQVWRSSYLPETAAQLILTDPHSPNEYRTNGIVSNMDEFYKAFDVKPGDKMYKPADKRIRIW